MVQDAVNNIIWNVKDKNEVIQKSCNYFDSLYQGLYLRIKDFHNGGGHAFHFKKLSIAV
jgi:hypothetical protein